MLGIQFILLSALLTALANLCMRRSIDQGGTTKAYLIVQLFLGFVTMLLLNPVRTGDYQWHLGMILFGVLSGVILAALMLSIGKALETGPSGLTFAILNSSTVVPILLMVFLLGKPFGFTYTLWNGIGSCLVIAGLFWAGWQTVKVGQLRQWLMFAFLAFACHVLFLALMQWRALLINFPTHESLLFQWRQEEAACAWFMPMLYLSASVVQAVIFWRSEKRVPTPHEVKYGVLGGIAHGAGSFFLILSAEKATSVEQAMIFPIFAVTIILVCNVWSRKLYQEKVHWRASAFCVLGLLVGTVDWKAFF